MHGGDKDDRGLLEAGMLTNEIGQFEAVDLRHAYIHQDDGDIPVEEKFQSLLARGGGDKVFS